MRTPAIASGMAQVRWNGRPEWTRTIDLFRVNFVVQTLKTFAFLAFPFSAFSKTGQKWRVLVTNW